MPHSLYLCLKVNYNPDVENSRKVSSTTNNSESKNEFYDYFSKVTLLNYNNVKL